MKNLIKNEFTKLILKKKYLVLLIIMAVLCIGRVGISFILSKVMNGNVVSRTIITDMLPLFAEIFVPLIIFMASTDLLATEMHDLSIKATLMRPATRFKILLSKLLAVFTLGGLFYLCSFVITALLQLIFGKITFEYAGLSFIAYIIDMITMFILVLFAGAINMISKTPTLSMFLAIILYALMKYLNYFSPAINSMLFTSLLEWHKLWIGDTIPFIPMLTKIGILFGSGTLLFTLSYLLFDKKEY